eukprot:gene25352-33087_t
MSGYTHVYYFPTGELLFVIVLFAVVFITEGSKRETFSMNCNSIENFTWLIGETPVTGFSNQLCAVYSYVPAAQLLQANLIVGEMFSRKSFEIKMRQYDKDLDGKVTLSFKDFFDIQWYQIYWGYNKLKILLIEDFKRCLETGTLLSRIQYIQRRKWRSASALELLSMVNASNIAYPPRSGDIFRFKSKFKMLALYNFGNEIEPYSTDLLFKVHQSIRPSEKIRSAVKTILDFLPSKFIVAHLRIEADVIFREDVFLNNTDPKFSMALPKIIATIKHSNCLLRNNTSSLNGTIYIASGVFSGKEYSLSKSRELTMRRILNEIGFVNVVSSRQFLSVAQNELFPAEYFAYIDLEIARRSDCFIPAHVPSSFSYTAQRIKELDAGIFHTKISSPNRRYSSYFF